MGATLLLAIPSPFFIRWTFNAYHYIVVPFTRNAHHPWVGSVCANRPSGENYFLMGLLAGFSWINIASSAFSGPRFSYPGGCRSARECSGMRSGDGPARKGRDPEALARVMESFTFVGTG